jgi:DNA-binding CsgD family transcriptional regulator
MQRPAQIERESRSIRELLVILCLAFGTWYLAELSNGILDFYAKASLIPALGLMACAVRLWWNLQRERDLRRQAEQMLRASRATVPEVEDAAVVAASPPMRSSPLPALTDRETEVLALIASSCTNQRIADALSISLNTVERHTANVYRKLGVRGRVEATHYAVRFGLVTQATVDRCREAEDRS